MLVPLYPFTGQGGSQCATQALTQKEQGLALYVRLVNQPSQAGLCVVQGAFYVRCASRAPISPVVDQEDVVALLREPGDVHDVAADVLGVAVKEVNSTFRFGAGGEPPAVEGFSVGGFHEHIFEFQVQAVGSDVGDLVRIEEHAAAAGLQQQGKRGGEAGQCSQSCQK